MSNIQPNSETKAAFVQAALTLFSNKVLWKWDGRTGHLLAVLGPWQMDVELPLHINERWQGKLSYYPIGEGRKQAPQGYPISYLKTETPKELAEAFHEEILGALTYAHEATDIYVSQAGHDAPASAKEVLRALRKHPALLFEVTRIIQRLGVKGILEMSDERWG